MTTNQNPIIEELSKHAESLKKDYFAVLRSTFYVKTRTLGGNTARAYKKGKCYDNYAPSSLVKHWLHHQFFGSPDTVRQLKTGMDFEAIHYGAVNSLENFWREKEPEATGMEFYHFTKIIDLMFKSITLWTELDEKRREWFFQNAHVPIDKYSLLILKEFHPEYDIPSPSMNYVGNSRPLYEKIQKDIREMIAPFPPLLFDLYAWNYRRSRQLEQEEDFALKKA